MVLTQSQKTQLHKDILEYFVNNDFPKSAQTFADEAELSIESVDPEGNKLELKWKSILSLQKKISNLEEKIAGLEESLAQAGTTGKQNTAVKLEDLYIPKVPAKFEMKGHKMTITSLAFHPQFTQAASSSEDGTVKIWDTESGEFERTLKGHTSKSLLIQTLLTA